MAIEALARVGIAECHAQRASTLSGGEQQRAAIARTLVQGSKVVLADEILSLPEAVAIVCRNPARATGLLDRGAIEPGLRADLVQVRVVNMPNGLRHGVVRAVWREGGAGGVFQSSANRQTTVTEKNHTQRV